MMAAPEFLAGRILGSVTSSEISAASGIVASQTNSGVLWTINDAGDSRVFATDVKGRLLGTFETGATVSDFEDISTGPGPTAGNRYLYVADIGDNTLARAAIKVVRFPEPAVTPGQPPVSTTATGVETLTFRYPDGPHNAETLIVDPASGDLYIVTRSDTRNRIYRAAFPHQTGTPTTLQYMAEMTWGGSVGGSISPDGSELLLKSPNTIYYYQRAVGTSISSALQAAPSTLPYTVQQLGEGIAFDTDGWGYFTNSEGVNQPVYYYERVSAATNAASFRFAVIGDYGVDDPNEAGVAQLVKTWDPSFVLTTGDNNYDVGAASTIDRNIGKHYSQFIGNYQGVYGPGASQNRFFPSLGNHDWETAGAQPYLDYFSLPGNERYYDFVKGPIHFFAIDSDPREPSGRSSTSAQAQWLQSALAASTSQYNVVYMHHPPYSSSSVHGPETVMQWPFRQWGADVVLAGHDHTYERLNVDGLPYIVNGLGGRNPYGFGTPIPGSLVRYNGNFGAQLVTVDPSGLKFDLYSVDGVLRDSLTIPATQPPQPLPDRTLVPTGATWKYLDTGTAPAAAWTTTSFNDTSWKIGPAQLGYGDGDEATIVSYGPSASNRHVTTYFRNSFGISDLAEIGNLTLRLKRDDGAVVYVNGREVVRSNMPAGAITNTTLARTALGGAAESTFYTFSVDRSALVNGTNVIAVEVHQANRMSDDGSFDLELISTGAVQVPQEATLVASGAIWRYLDTGGEPPASWRSGVFNEAGWKSGRTQAGYGEGDESTIVSYGPNPNSKRVSTYFRTSFNADPAQISALTLQLLRDDGAVVYLNGVEIIRSNMPTGAISFDTLAATNVASGDERIFLTHGVPVDRLVSGNNVMAVELHQANPAGHDASFDLRLTGTLKAGLSALGQQPELTEQPGPYPAMLTEGHQTEFVAARIRTPFEQVPAITNTLPSIRLTQIIIGQRTSQSDLADRRSMIRRAIDRAIEIWDEANALIPLRTSPDQI